MRKLPDLQQFSEIFLKLFYLCFCNFFYLFCFFVNFGSFNDIK